MSEVLQHKGSSEATVGRCTYKLILGANRDELFIRKALPAGFWDGNPHVLAGKDMTPGKEGGTWIGINKTGNLGLLTNYRQKSDFETESKRLNLKSRGPLVSNYLKENSDPVSYADILKQEENNYDAFNAIFGCLTKDGYQCVYINNIDKEKPHILEPGVHGLSNYYINNSWTKVVVGKQRLSEISEQDLNKEDLINKILDLLGDDTRYHPNDGGSGIGLPEEVAPAASSICVKMPEWLYGTRTHTVILIDNNNSVTFVERTMSDPMNLEDPGWMTNRFEFQIEGSGQL